MTRDIDHPAVYPNLPAVEPRLNAYARLKPAEKVFVEAYLAHLGSSAKAAGKSVVDACKGFPEVDNSDRARGMLLRSNVRDAIHERAREIASKFALDANTVIKEVANIATANMANYLHITENGEPYIDLGNCSFDQFAAISEVTVEDFTEGRGDNARDVRRVKIKLHDKLNALDKLMKYLNMYAPEQVVVRSENVNVNVNMTPEQAAEMYQARLRSVNT